MAKSQSPDENLQTLNRELEAAKAETQAEREAKLQARGELAEQQNRVKSLEKQIAKGENKRAKLIDAFGRLEEHVNASLLPEIRRLRKQAEEA